MVRNRSNLRLSFNHGFWLFDRFGDCLKRGFRLGLGGIHQFCSRFFYGFRTSCRKQNLCKFGNWFGHTFSFSGHKLSFRSLGRRSFGLEQGSRRFGPSKSFRKINASFNRYGRLCGPFARAPAFFRHPNRLGCRGLLCWIHQSGCNFRGRLNQGSFFFRTLSEAA